MDDNSNCYFDYFDYSYYYSYFGCNNFYCYYSHLSHFPPGRLDFDVDLALVPDLLFAYRKPHHGDHHKIDKLGVKQVGMGNHFLDGPDPYNLYTRHFPYPPQVGFVG
jgi:hypothetical protein